MSRSLFSYQELKFKLTVSTFMKIWIMKILNPEKENKKQKVNTNNVFGMHKLK